MIITDLDHPQVWKFECKAKGKSESLNCNSFTTTYFNCDIISLEYLMSVCLPEFRIPSIVFFTQLVHENVAIFVSNKKHVLSQSIPGTIHFRSAFMYVV